MVRLGFLVAFLTRMISDPSARPVQHTLIEANNTETGQ
jgi:hypothetical protein